MVYFSIMNINAISENIKRYRYNSKMTQNELADKSGVSLPTIKKIEGGSTGVRQKTLDAIAKALDITVEMIVQPARRLRTLRFRSCKNMRSKESVASFIVNKLDQYNNLEGLLDVSLPPVYKSLTPSADPVKMAEQCRAVLGYDNISPIDDITSAVTGLGVKLFNVHVNTEKFFGLSVGEPDGGPAIIVNKNDKISFEQTIFAIAHELGHLLMHQGHDKKVDDALIWAEEDEAELFASHFLMPQDGFRMHWNDSRGLLWTDRVIKVKHIYGVHYKTILHRLGDFDKYFKMFCKSFGDLRRGKDPEPLQKSLYIEERFYSLVSDAVTGGLINVEEGASILDIKPDEMKRLTEPDIIITV